MEGIVREAAGCAKTVLLQWREGVGLRAADVET